MSTRENSNFDSDDDSVVESSRDEAVWHVAFAKESTTNGAISKGCLVGISPAPLTGSKEKVIFGHTKTRELRLIECLLKGELTINVKLTTADQLTTEGSRDARRIEATDIVRTDAATWKNHRLCQKHAPRQSLVRYVAHFLNEFVSRTKHIPLRTKLDLYPSALLQPNSQEVLVGRDGVAIVFTAPEQPPVIRVEIADRVLDSMLLLHPAGKSYDCEGPSSILSHVCSDTNYIYLRGNGGSNDSWLGNPLFVVTEKRLQYFLETIRLVRHYRDGTTVGRFVDFAEIFGDCSESNFTEGKARERAKTYANQWALNKITGGKISSIVGLRAAVDRLRHLVESTPSVPEPEIEEVLNDHPWLIERGLGYKSFKSQIEIPEDCLSRSDKGIKPDKFLERHDGFCDILDLKRADARLLIVKDNRNHRSANLTEAESQVQTYLDYAKEPKVREFLAAKGIRVLYPRGLLIMGRRKAEPNADQWEEVRSRLNVDLYTYDDLIAELDLIILWIEKIG